MRRHGGVDDDRTPAAGDAGHPPPAGGAALSATSGLLRENRRSERGLAAGLRTQLRRFGAEQRRQVVMKPQRAMRRHRQRGHCAAEHVGAGGVAARGLGRHDRCGDRGRRRLCRGLHPLAVIHRHGRCRCRHRIGGRRALDAAAAGGRTDALCEQHQGQQQVQQRSDGSVHSDTIGQCRSCVQHTALRHSVRAPKPGAALRATRPAPRESPATAPA